MKFTAGQRFYPRHGKSYFAVAHPSADFALHELHPRELGAMPTWGDDLLRGVPVYWADDGAGGIMIWPTPDADYEVTTD